MRTALRKAWELRTPRERRLIGVLAVLLITVLYLWLVISADQARVQLRSTVPVLRDQAYKFGQQVSEYERLKAAPPVPLQTDDLREVVQAQVDAAGLSRALISIDTIDRDQVQVVFNAVPFSDWLGWVATMQLQRVRLGSGRIEALSEPGVVNVTATFIRATAD